MAVAEIIRGEVKALIDEGVPYIQLDNPHYTDFVSDDIRDPTARSASTRCRRWRTTSRPTTTRSRASTGRDNVIIGMHYCRGNTGGGGWHKAGGYDRVAEISFGGLDVDNFLLEYDTERAGTFEPLRFMPKGKTVVLGPDHDEVPRARVAGRRDPRASTRRRSTSTSTTAR